MAKAARWDVTDAETRKRDAATPRAGRRPSGRKPLSVGTKLRPLIADWSDGTFTRSPG